MVNALRNVSGHIQNRPILIAWLLFLVGLVIQTIVIILSFSWSDEQFGPPTTSPGLFILATVLTLFPILGFVAFANFALIFLTIHEGSNWLSHPWFYHLVGMAVFNIGMIARMIISASERH